MASSSLMGVEDCARVLNRSNLSADGFFAAEARTGSKVQMTALRRCIFGSDYSMQSQDACNGKMLWFKYNCCTCLRRSVHNVSGSSK